MMTAHRTTEQNDNIKDTTLECTVLNLFLIDTKLENIFSIIN